MVKPSINSQIPLSSSSSSVVSSDINPSWVSNVHDFLHLGTSSNLPEDSMKKDLVSDIMCDILKVDQIEPGRVTCHLTVKPRVTNGYGTFHGGTVAGVAELVSLACARTVVGEDKDLFLRELAMSYLSAASVNVVLGVEARIVRSGRNVTTTSVEFRIKDSMKLTYTARATFFTKPLANL